MRMFQAFLGLRIPIQEGGEEAGSAGSLLLVGLYQSQAGFLGQVVGYTLEGQENVGKDAAL